MNENTTDYIALINLTPAFADNNVYMVQNILDADGTCPSFTIKTRDGAEIPDTDPIEYEQEEYLAMNPMPGSKEGNGKAMIHFRLPVKLSASGVTDLLTNGMTPPMSPISIESIRSAYKIVKVDDGVDGDGNAIGHYEYDVVVQAMRSRFLPYMIEDTDELGNPLGTINENLSGYVGSEPILLA